jgi:uncharacterized SAM-binding protein YcdF (DUF218 family)
MLFVLAKLAGMALQPINLALLLAGTGMLVARRRRAAGRVLLAGGALLFFSAGFTQLPDYLLARLEQAEPQGEFPSDIAGIVVLGGGVDADAAHAGSPGWDGYRMGEGGERIVHGLKLRRAYPGARFIFSGGVANLVRPGTPEAAAARAAIEAIAGTAKDMEFEAAARNTTENAANVLAMAGPDARRPWLLVTSAFHMRRALAAFRKAGMNVVAAPTDFRADKPQWPWLSAAPAGQFAKAGLWLHETAGLLAWRLAGRA